MEVCTSVKVSHVLKNKCAICAVCNLCSSVDASYCCCCSLQVEELNPTFYACHTTLHTKRCSSDTVVVAKRRILLIHTARSTPPAGSECTNLNSKNISIKERSNIPVIRSAGYEVPGV